MQKQRVMVSLDASARYAWPRARMIVRRVVESIVVSFAGCWMLRVKEMW